MCMPSARDRWRTLEQRGTAWEYLLADALGSVRQIVDANGNVTLAESYEPYGSVLTINGTASSIFGYAGEQIDTYIKLLFLRARYYSPETARFLSKDMWQGDYTRPQSLNAWMYVEGDPINHVDPAGQWRCYPFFQNTQICTSWVKEALKEINKGGDLSHQFYERLRSDDNVVYLFNGNDNDYATIPIVPVWDYVILASSWLSDPLPPPIQHIQWFVHETTHSFRNPAERTTIFGEVEAYTVQAGILKELGHEDLVEEYMKKLINTAVEGGQVTRNMTKLADARCKLVDYFKGTPREGVYASIALIFDHGMGWWEICHTCK